MKRRDRQQLSDEDLASLTRSGDSKAFAELWDRHVRPGYVAARHFSSIADPDDIVAEAYLRIFRAIQSGGGPKEAFRPYLYRTIRNVALGWRTASTAVPLDEADDIVDDRVDIETTTVENTITGKAFRSLPERWQTILWYTEVEGMEPAEAAPLVGLSAGATAALAYRARDGLKKAWLQAHVSDVKVPPECRWTTERMGEYARGGLTPRARARFESHVATCMRCGILVEEVDQIGDRLAAFLLPAMLGGVVGTQMLIQSSSVEAASALPRSTKNASPSQTVTMAVGATVLAGGIAAAITLAFVGLSLMDPIVNPETSEQEQATPPQAGGKPDVTPPTDVPPEPPTYVIPPPPVVTPPEPPTDVMPVIPFEPPIADLPEAPPTPDVPPALPEPLPEPPPTPDIPPVLPEPPPATDPTPEDPPPPADPDTTPPASPGVDSPADGTLTAQSAPTLAGTGEPGALVEVRWDSGEGIQTIATATVGDDGGWVAIASTNLPDGTVTLQISQVDKAGNRSEPTIRALTIDTIAIAPVVQPSDPGLVFFLPTITGEAEPFALVELFDEEASVVGTATSDETGTWSIPLPDPGRDDQLLSAQQTDLAGNISPLSVPHDPIVFERPSVVTPIPGGSLPSTDGVAVITVQMDGVPGMTVQVFVDGTTTGNLHILENAPISRVTPPLPIGTHTIGVRYTDAQNRVGSWALVTFNVS